MKRAQIDKSFGLSGATRLAPCNLLPLSHSLEKLCPMAGLNMSPSPKRVKQNTHIGCLAL